MAYYSGNFLSEWGTFGFSKSTQLHGVNSVGYLAGQDTVFPAFLEHEGSSPSSQ